MYCSRDTICLDYEVGSHVCSRTPLLSLEEWVLMVITPIDKVAIIHNLRCAKFFLAEQQVNNDGWVKPDVLRFHVCSKRENYSRDAPIESRCFSMQIVQGR